MINTKEMEQYRAYFFFEVHWEKVLVVVTRFFCKKGSQVYSFIVYYLYTLVLTTRFIK